MNGEVVSTFTFLEGSPDEGVVEVRAPASAGPHRTVRVFLCTGRYRVALPRRGLGEIIGALQRAKTTADEQYMRLVEKMNGEGHG